MHRHQPQKKRLCLLNSTSSLRPGVIASSYPKDYTSDPTYSTPCHSTVEPDPFTESVRKHIVIHELAQVRPVVQYSTLGKLKP